MTDLRAAAQQALEALEAIDEDPHGTHSFPALSNDAITALRAALAQQEQAITPAELSAALGWPGGISTPVLGKVELLRMVAQQEQEPVAYLLGTKSKPDWPYHSRTLVFADQTTVEGLPASQAHMARQDGQMHEAVPLYTHPPRRETEQEPVAWCTLEELAYLKRVIPSDSRIPLYTKPPRREWVSLPACEDKPHAVLVEGYGYVDVRAVRAIEQVLRSKNDAVR